MKKDIHPKYGISTITCACGEVIKTRSTKKEIKVGVCSKCHPFFTGTQKFLDTAGRVEKFIKKYAGIEKKPKKVRPRAVAPAEAAPKPPSGKTAPRPAAAPGSPASPPVEAVPESPAVSSGDEVPESPAALSGEETPESPAVSSGDEIPPVAPPGEGA